MNDREMREQRSDTLYAWIGALVFVISILIAIGGLNGLRLLIQEWYAPPQYAACPSNPDSSPDGPSLRGDAGCPADPINHAPSGPRRSPIS